MIIMAMTYQPLYSYIYRTVKILAGLYFVIGIVNIIFLFLIFVFLDIKFSSPVSELTSLTLLILLFAIPFFITGLAIWFMKTWAWICGMVVSIIGLLFYIPCLLFGTIILFFGLLFGLSPPIFLLISWGGFGLIISILTLFELDKREVKSVFGEEQINYIPYQLLIPPIKRY